MLFALFLTLLAFINSALAADKPLIQFVAPSDTYNAPYYQDNWYKIGVYEGVKECPPQLQTVYVADGQPHEPALFNFGAPPWELDVGRTYVVGTYHRSGTQADGTPVWAISAGSCKPSFTVAAGDKDRLYAPLLGTWRPSGDLLHATVTATIPALQSGYVLYYEYGGSDCSSQIDPRHHDGKVIPLTPATTQAVVELAGGTWLFGIYHEDTPAIIAFTAVNPQSMRYRLVGNTCQQIKVVDFSGLISYQPNLPVSSLLNKPKPAEQFAASALFVGSVPERLTLGFQVRFDYVRWSYFVATANLGADFSVFHPLDTLVPPNGGVGVGYTRTHPLPEKYIMQWAITGNVGVGSVLLRCPNDVYADGVTYTCGANNDGFPVVQVAPWFGPGGTLRFLGPNGGRHIGIEFWLQGQIYRLDNQSRELSVQTTAGDQTIHYVLEQDEQWWFQPRGGLGLVLEW